MAEISLSTFPHKRWMKYIYQNFQGSNGYIQCSLKFSHKRRLSILKFPHKMAEISLLKLSQKMAEISLLKFPHNMAEVSLLKFSHNRWLMSICIPHEIQLLKFTDLAGQLTGKKLTLKVHSTLLTADLTEKESLWLRHPFLLQWPQQERHTDHTVLSQRNTCHYSRFTLHASPPQKTTQCMHPSNNSEKAWRKANCQSWVQLWKGFHAAMASSAVTI